MDKNYNEKCHSIGSQIFYYCWRKNHSDGYVNSHKGTEFVKSHSDLVFLFKKRIREYIDVVKSDIDNTEFI